MSYQVGGSAAEARVGSTVGPYRLESVIGVGGMSSVFGTRDPHGRRLALKLIKEDFAWDETFRRRFSREVRIAQTIVNPHVVPVLDTGEDDGLPYLVTPFIEGGSLADRLRRDGPLAVAAAVRICGDVADGLEALWAASMIHRDIKPANLLLDQDGVAHITDFGVAKDSQGTRLTQPGSRMGSMDYMAPEQIRGEEVTTASDMYALGCVTFECLAGRPPFAHREGMQVLMAHLHEDPPDIGRDDVGPELGEALKAALRKHPAERPRSSLEYARSLSIAAGEP
jgi:serine/threonine protein kinase